MSDRTWMAAAACVGTPTDIFFRERGTPTSEYVALRQLCASCPVQAPCLAYATADPDLHGFWGGCTRKERTEIRKEQRRAVA